MEYFEGSIGKNVYFIPKAAYDFLESFQKKHHLADLVPEYFVSALNGRIEPNINYITLYQEWLEAQKKVPLIKTEKAALSSLGRRYRDLDRRIEKDPALTQSFKEHWKLEYKVLRHALEDGNARVLDFFKPYPPFTVRLDNKEISRQGFWSEIVYKLVTVVRKNVGLSLNQSSAFLAKLFSLSFPRIDNPQQPSFDADNIKRRFYHAKNRFRE